MVKEESYKEKYERLEKEYEGLNALRWVFVALSIFLVCSLIFLAIRFSDNVDIDDELGPYLCAQHGMYFIDTEYSLKDFNLDYLQIRCGATTEIADGYLVEYGGISKRTIR